MNIAAAGECSAYVFKTMQFVAIEVSIIIIGFQAINRVNGVTYRLRNIVTTSLCLVGYKRFSKRISVLVTEMHIPLIASYPN